MAEAVRRYGPERRRRRTPEELRGRRAELGDDPARLRAAADYLERHA
jgi:hypothetical protein